MMLRCTAADAYTILALRAPLSRCLPSPPSQARGTNAPPASAMDSGGYPRLQIASIYRLWGLGQQADSSQARQRPLRGLQAAARHEAVCHMGKDVTPGRALHRRHAHIPARMPLLGRIRSHSKTQIAVYFQNSLGIERNSGTVRMPAPEGSSSVPFRTVPVW